LNSGTLPKLNLGKLAAPEEVPRNIETGSLSSRRMLSINYFNNYVDKRALSNRMNTGAGTSRNKLNSKK